MGSLSPIRFEPRAHALLRFQPLACNRENTCSHPWEPTMAAEQSRPCSQ